MFTAKIRSLPSPALVVALVALVAALAGSAVALPGKNKVDRNDIRKSAVAGKQVKNDSVTGADVAESTLGTVPSAASAVSARNADHAASAANANHAATADSATSADHAATAGDAEFAVSAEHASNITGVRLGNLFFRAPVSTPAAPQLTVQGLSLSLGCSAAGQPIALASTTNTATELSGHTVSSGGANLTYTDDNGFTNVDILQTGFGSGTLTYAAGSGASVTMDYGFDSSTVFGGQSGCAFWGTLVEAQAQF